MALYGMYCGGEINDTIMACLWRRNDCSMVCLSGCTMAFLWRRNDGVMVCQWRRLNDNIRWGRHVP